MIAITTNYPFIGSVETKQGGRKENQDNAGFVDTPLGLLVVVCDGMGGGPGGRTASLMALEIILNTLASVSEQTDRQDALRFGIEKANDIIYAKSKDTPELRGMGTTVAAILINERSAMIAHVGDSRIYQLRKGSVIYRSADHSFVADLVRQKTITEEQARNHPRSNVITRALGIRPAVEVEFDEVSFARADRFVICTDGIWGMMPQPELVRSLSRVMGVNELTAVVANEIDEMGSANGGGHDNLTLAVVDASFDSSLKKSMLTRHDGNTIGDSRLTKSLLIKILLTALLVIAAVVAAFFFFNSGQKVEKESPNEDIKEIVNQKFPNAENNPKITDKTEPEDSDNNLDDSKVPSIPRYDGKLEVLHHDSSNDPESLVNGVMNGLEILKRYKGKNKKETQEEKRTIVKKVIKKVSRMKNILDASKKKDVEDIIKLLYNRRIISCDFKGETTAEALEYIDEIKQKILKLYSSR